MDIKTKRQLDDLERLANNATDGPWKSDIRVGSAAIYPAKYDINCFCDDEHIICKLNGKYSNDRWSMSDKQIADAKFIAAAREAVPMLIKRIRELEEEAAYLAWEIAYNGTCCPLDLDQCPGGGCSQEQRAECWRTAARNAV